MAAVVISYARHDRPLVHALLKFLRGALPEFSDAVYWDDDFEPGRAWIEQIQQHIDSSPQLFVFWCAHSVSSKHVGHEYRYALQARKRVVPVLLDHTSLPHDLDELHAIDLRGAITHHVDPSTSRSRFVSAIFWLAVVLLSALALVWFPELRLEVIAFALVAGAAWIWMLYASPDRRARRFRRNVSLFIRPLISSEAIPGITSQFAEHLREPSVHGPELNAPFGKGAT